ncbi:MAG TPA: archease [Methylomirabilota bacterium]|jgi:SHS2 domain-containing protein|nr:archease [Methylomirabilota bacterium]
MNVEPPVPEGFEYFEVAADVGVHAWGPTLEACFRQCALGMFNLMVPLDAVAPAESREVGAQGETPELLLVNWLNDLLYLHDVEGFAVRDVAALRFEGPRVHAELTGEPVDPARHPRGVLVKAATFHQLALVREPGRTSVRLVLDI